MNMAAELAEEILENGTTTTTTTACPFAQSQLSNDIDEINKFHILDETEDNEDSDNYDDDDDDDSDVPDDEIEKMLEEALITRKRDAGEAGLDDSINFEEKSKVILIEKGQNHFDVLPEGWIQVSHNSGMPIYLHKSARVCTLSKPYFLGPGSARKHQIPITAIPCLNYKRALEKEAKALLQKNREGDSEQNSITSQNGNSTHNIPNAKIETVQENLQHENLTPEQMREYCESLFKFQSMKVLRFKSWAERRKFTKKRKQEKQLQRPTLPDGTKLITFPIRSAENSENPFTTKEWTMNPNGKSYVCILHEYVQHALKKQPSYQFTELSNAATPYSATVIIKDMKYGSGFGASKKQAKSEAAKATLEILIPEMKSKITLDERSDVTNKTCIVSYRYVRRIKDLVLTLKSRSTNIQSKFPYHHIPYSIANKLLINGIYCFFYVLLSIYIL